jgi:hypothetical protein
VIPTPPPQGTKEWFIPCDIDSYKTFIDHDCQLDRQGYPIYPNGRTTFVNLREMEVTNFGSVGFTKRMGIETPKDPGWKIKCIYCLGVMLCDQQGFQWAGSPPTSTNSIANFLARSVISAIFSLLERNEYLRLLVNLLQ